MVDRSYPNLQYATFLTNHDQNRVLDQLGGNLTRMKQAAALYLTMPGVPFLYYGEEVGMLGTGVDEDKRKPMQWTAGTQAGFTTGSPWRGLNGNYAQFNVATQQADPNSLLNHYKQLIRLRNTHEALRKGYLLPLTSPTSSVLSYARVHQQQAVLTVANMGSSANPALSLALSTLPAGVYRVTELLTGQAAGTVTLDAQGGFTNWTSSLTTLGANQSWLLHLSPTQITATARRATFTTSLYPNPATQQVTVELPTAAPAQLLVYTVQGQLLRTIPLTGRRHTLDTSTWTNGTYLLRIRSGAAVSVQRLVVAR